MTLFKINVQSTHEFEMFLDYLWFFLRFEKSMENHTGRCCMNEYWNYGFTTTWKHIENFKKFLNSPDTLPELEVQPNANLSVYIFFK